MALRSLAFRNSARIESASKSRPPIARGEKGEGVALMQGALIQLGFKMPGSTRRLGAPDGIFGNQTEEVVRRFQAANTFKVDGIAGRVTIGRLDERTRPTS